MALNAIHIMELTTKKIPANSDKFRQAGAGNSQTKESSQTPLKNFPLQFSLIRVTPEFDT